MSEAKPRRPGREAPRNNDTDGGDVSAVAGPPTIAPVAPEAAKEPVPGEVPAVPPLPAATTHPEPASLPTGESFTATKLPADDSWSALAEMQAALATGCEEIALEIAAIARCDIAAATDAATAMLGARTFPEAVEISAAMIRRRADAAIEGSAKLSEIGMQAAAAASRPILACLAAGWSAAGDR